MLKFKIARLSNLLTHEQIGPAAAIATTATTTIANIHLPKLFAQLLLAAAVHFSRFVHELALVVVVNVVVVFISPSGSG